MEKFFVYKLLDYVHVICRWYWAEYAERMFVYSLLEYSVSQLDYNKLDGNFVTDFDSVPQFYFMDPDYWCVCVNTILR